MKLNYKMNYFVHGEKGGPFFIPLPLLCLSNKGTPLNPSSRLRMRAQLLTTSSLYLFSLPRNAFTLALFYLAILVKHINKQQNNKQRLDLIFAHIIRYHHAISDVHEGPNAQAERILP